MSESFDKIPGSQSTWRILDANCNRATEACRVIEEYCRFHLNSVALATSSKDLRHQINSTLQELVSVSGSELLAHRDTDHDVGTRISADDEMSRDSLEQLVSANFSRLQQSLRSLEEYCKTLPDIQGESAQDESVPAAGFERARYESYQLQKSVFHCRRGNEALANSVICVLTDGCDDAERFGERVQLLLDAGVDMIQLRDKELESRELLERALIARRLATACDKTLIVNDRPDICLLSGADGVHVGQTDLAVSEARRIVGSKLVGVSTHSVDDALRAVRDGADYIGVGPMFASTTKQFSELKGCDLLRAVTTAVDLPAFAIGGIDQSNVQQIMAAGGRRVAVAGGVWNADDPAAEVVGIRNLLCSGVCSGAGKPGTHGTPGLDTADRN